MSPAAPPGAITGPIPAEFLIYGPDDYFTSGSEGDEEDEYL